MRYVDEGRGEIERERKRLWLCSCMVEGLICSREVVRRMRKDYNAGL